MADYLLLDSGGQLLADAAVLAEDGHRVSVVFVQDAVFAAAHPATAGLTRLLDAGARVRADDFSLRQRALRPDDLAAGVTVTEMDAVMAEVLAPSVRVVWR